MITCDTYPEGDRRHRGAPDLALRLGPDGRARAARARDARRDPAEEGRGRWACASTSRSRSSSPSTSARNVRELEGALKRVLAYARFHGQRDHARRSAKEALQRPARRAEPPDLDREHPEDGRRLLQDQGLRHALARSARAPSRGRARSRWRSPRSSRSCPCRRSASISAAATTRRCCTPAAQIAKLREVDAGPQPRRQFPAAGAAQLTTRSPSKRADVRRPCSLENAASNGYNLWIKRPGGRTRNSPQTIHSPHSGYHGSSRDAQVADRNATYRRCPAICAGSINVTISINDNAIKTDRTRRAAEPLQAVTGIVERRHTLPILSNVLLEQQGRQAVRHRHRSRDPDHRASAISPARTARRPPSARASCRTSCARCRTTPSSTSTQPASKMTVRAGRSRFNLQTLAGERLSRASASARSSCRRCRCRRSDLRALLKLVRVRDGAAGHPLLPERHAARRRQGHAAGGRDRRPSAVVGEPRARRRATRARK